jgi:hypothetical protein
MLRSGSALIAFLIVAIPVMLRIRRHRFAVHGLDL